MRWSINPVHLNLDGWYFWDEAWAHEQGPYGSYAEARRECEHYYKVYLNGGATMSYNLWWFVLFILIAITLAILAGLFVPFLFDLLDASRLMEVIK